ncbi:calcium-binding protein [Clostridium sp. AL.422]|uniref:SpaA isopeptide-forming pilin-related protein n=1 Tax=Clostridium TaxID=1485 RepID=UPI00293DBF96|nr:MULTISPECIES: SpaA isopeptide-forming pilin-related protein [unclassified Clostridium]MDV4149766.1 calcium-binding protein [Clostridium sp. AL.422]
MKIVIDDQYHSDENKKFTVDQNKQFTVDENGNIDLLINIGETLGDSNTLESNNNINYTEGENVIESDFTEMEDKINNIVKNNNEEIINNCIKENDEETISSGTVKIDLEEPGVGSTINSENPWKEEKFSRDYNSIYAEIESSLEKKYANQNEVVDRDDTNLRPMHIRYEENKGSEEKGSINVFSRLGNKEGVELKGARINLYLLNGVSPKLYDSKFTDASGKVEFNNLPNGCYRIIAIVDRRFFEKPVYYNWNEVTIDSNNKNANVLVVNKIKPGYYKR